jgi:phosphoribosylaminoimidazole-succinocarboxamide synthase
MDLVDVTIQFARNKDQIIVTGELSPDTMRLWDKVTHEKLDADRFRNQLGNVADAYREVARRLGISREQ